MPWSAIFRDTYAALRASLPAALCAPRWSATTHMAKAWYGNPALHYEIWVRARLRVVELGLHFEADDLTNARLLAAFRARAPAVKRALGPEARIEDWDRGWARVWEPLSLELAGAELRERVVSRFVAYVRVLEPILRGELPADVEWKPPAGGRGAAAQPERRPRISASRTSRSGRRSAR